MVLVGVDCRRRLDGEPTVDVEILAGDEAGPLGGQKADRFRYVLGRAERAKWNVGSGRGERPLIKVAAGHEAFRHSVGEHSRTHRVGPHTESALLRGDAFHGSLHGRLGNRGQAVAHRETAGGGRGDGHDAAFRLSQMRQAGHGDREEANCVVSQLGLHLGWADSAQVHLWNVGTRRVHEGVDTSSGIGDRINICSAGVVIGKIQFNCPCGAAGVADRGRDASGSLFTGPVGDGNITASSSQFHAYDLSESTAAPDDEGRSGPGSEVVRQVRSMGSHFERVPEPRRRRQPNGITAGGEARAHAVTYDHGMRLGVSITSAHNVADPAVGARNMIERARVARDAGLDSLSLGDHHATSIPYYQGVPMLGRLTAEWDTTRPTGCLFLLPLWNPVLAAEQIGVLASLCRGTFVVQTGIGGGDQQFEAMGADMSTRGRVIDESIGVMKELLKGQTVTSNYFGISGAIVNPRPSGDVEWWIGAGGPGPLRRAAREGDAWYAGPAVTADLASEMLETYRSACRDHGRKPRAIVRKDVIVLRDGDRARALGDGLVSSGYRGMPRDAVAYGNVDDVVEQLAPFRELGFSDVIVRCMTIEQPDALETLELCGEVRNMLA